MEYVRIYGMVCNGVNVVRKFCRACHDCILLQLTIRLSLGIKYLLCLSVKLDLCMEHNRNAYNKQTLFV